MVQQQSNGIITDFQHYISKNMVKLEITLSNGKTVSSYISNVKKTPKNNLSVSKNSDIAKLYRLATGNNSAQAYSDAKRIFNALKNKQIEVVCDIETKQSKKGGHSYNVAKNIKPLNSIASNAWDMTGRLLKTPSSTIHLSLNHNIIDLDKLALESITIKFLDGSHTFSIDNLARLCEEIEASHKAQFFELVVAYNNQSIADSTISSNDSIIANEDKPFLQQNETYNNELAQSYFETDYFTDEDMNKLSEQEDYFRNHDLDDELTSHPMP
ncbi:hypothetical protein [Thiomicrospira microaerophila]|uniref:hypothetical protein n=1 Tax=Thiomicrospira microaerophila TaxID=406020 RepID=UPI0005CB0630|nr:hypothetical protein [Thiomicrospira microaerophila]